MKKIFLLLSLTTYIFASLNEINSFKADFIQTVTNDKNKVLKYEGKILASKPQNAKWEYITPIKKDIYINSYKVTIVEPEIEQVIIREIESDFDFFKMIQNATEIKKGKFKTIFEKTTYYINIKNNLIDSISYKDQFENSVKISFTNQIQNEKIDKQLFQPKFSLDFDIIRD